MWQHPENSLEFAQVDPWQEYANDWMCLTCHWWLPNPWVKEKAGLPAQIWVCHTGPRGLEEISTLCSWTSQMPLGQFLTISSGLHSIISASQKQSPTSSNPSFKTYSYAWQLVIVPQHGNE